MIGPESAMAPGPRYGHGLTSTAGSLYLFGGFGDSGLPGHDLARTSMPHGWRSHLCCLGSKNQRFWHAQDAQDEGLLLPMRCHVGMQRMHQIHLRTHYTQPKGRGFGSSPAHPRRTLLRAITPRILLAF
jgi:hypothetical protein